MCAFEIFWNPPQGVDHGKPEKLSLTEKKLFYDIKIDATGPIWPLNRHQNWCHSTKTCFRLSSLAPKRSQLQASSRIWRQNGANLSQNLLPHHYRNLRASKTTFIFQKFKKFFSCWASDSPQTKKARRFYSAGTKQNKTHYLSIVSLMIRYGTVKQSATIYTFFASELENERWFLVTKLVIRADFSSSINTA